MCLADRFLSAETFPGRKKFLLPGAQFCSLGVINFPS